MDTSQSDFEATMRRLRRFHEGLLRADELIERVRFVTEPTTGRYFLPVQPHIFAAESLTLHIPDDANDALHVAVTASEANPDREAGCDRYLIYFGRAEHARWAALDIESVKHVDVVIDGPDAQLPNPLALVEARACKVLNATPAVVAKVCRERTGVEPDNPRLVGIDCYGMDVRARFGIIRVEFDAKVQTTEALMATVRALTGGAVELAP